MPDSPDDFHAEDTNEADDPRAEAHRIASELIDRVVAEEAFPHALDADDD